MLRQFRPSVRPSVCPSVYLSVTRVHYIQTAEHIVEILSLSDRPIILVFRDQDFLHKSDGFTPNGGAEFPAYSWVLSLWPAGVRLASVRAAWREAEGRQARERVPWRDSAECIIQRRFAIRVDSVPSCKLGSARRRPRVQGVAIFDQYAAI